jgi:hypothetical protein
MSTELEKAAMEEATDRIYITLHAYTCLGYRSDDGSPASLLDALSWADDSASVENADAELGELAADLATEIVAPLITERDAAITERDRLREEIGSLMAAVENGHFCVNVSEHIEVLGLRSERNRLREALKEIQKGDGAFSRDPLTHASNCIDNMKAIARKALEQHHGH